MKILCLGTGAADWPIERFEEFPKFRRFTSSLVDGTLLIDPGPHIFHYMEHNACPGLLDGVTDILVTHSHGDHFHPATVQKLTAKGNVTLWGGFACLQRLTEALGEETAAAIPFHELQVGDKVQIGAYEVVTLPANHSTKVPGERPFHYSIFDGDKRVFYGMDGAWLLREEWNMIRAEKWQYDAMILDATMGDCPGDLRIFEHNTLDMIAIMAQTFRSQKVLKPESGQLYANHMARTLHTDHKTLKAALAPLDIIPCYDGMEITV